MSFVYVKAIAFQKKLQPLHVVKSCSLILLISFLSLYVFGGFGLSRGSTCIVLLPWVRPILREHLWSTFTVGSAYLEGALAEYFYLYVTTQLKNKKHQLKNSRNKPLVLCDASFGRFSLLPFIIRTFNKMCMACLI